MINFFKSRTGIILAATAVAYVVGILISQGWMTIPLVVFGCFLIYPRNTAATWQSRDDLYRRLALADRECVELRESAAAAARRFAIVARRLDVLERRMESFESVEVEARARLEYRVADLNDLVAVAGLEKDH